MQIYYICVYIQTFGHTPQVKYSSFYKTTSLFHFDWTKWELQQNREIIFINNTK